eukprot:10829-Heterococcus_DN1.PRE.4
MVLANTLLPEAVSPHERIPLRLEMIEAGILQSLQDVREQYEQIIISGVCASTVLAVISVSLAVSYEMQYLVQELELHIAQRARATRYTLRIKFKPKLVHMHYTYALHMLLLYATG